MKKMLALGLALVTAAVMATGCSSSTDDSASTGSDNTAATEDTSFSAPISVVSREEGSGTRGAFIELFGIEQKNDAGEKIDYTTDLAEITNSTSVMITTIAGNKNAIGYISLGSLKNDVKALKIDGADATVENIKNGSYKIARPFNIATLGEDKLSAEAKDFITFIMSNEGQSVIEEKGYISQGASGSYTPAKLSGKITVAGSSSVTPVMESLKEAYIALNPDVNIEVQQSDSTTGMTSAIEGICDIGMASRELKDSETSAGLTPTVIAMDGIAVIVNNENLVSELTSDRVKAIFTGETENWSEVVK